jgi:hypothetical protein
MAVAVAVARFLVRLDRAERVAVVLVAQVTKLDQTGQITSEAEAVLPETTSTVETAVQA